LLRNSWIVARREFVERVRSRLFGVSTLLLAALAVVVAFTPIIVRIADRGTTTTIAVAADDDELAQRAISIMGGVLNVTGRTDPSAADPYRFVRADDPAGVEKDVSDGRYDGAIVARRDTSGRIDFTFLTGEGIGADRAQIVGVGTLAVAILDWTATNSSSTTKAFVIPTLEVIAAAGPTPGGKPLPASEFASRRIIGIVFVILIFITLVIYGMWVAAGVVAEKSSRVMELLISAASPRQLVAGKVVGIGLAGLVQYVAVLIPALLALFVEERVAAIVLGSSAGVTASLSALTPELLVAYGLFWILGFVLYALLYAAVGSLVSRAEDLQVIALPLSLVAIGGYLQAVMALSGGTSTLLRVSSYVPFWSPFIMLTRLTVGRVEPWELALAYGLLVAGILVVAWIAVRVYAAGVLLYGQRPGLRAIVSAVVRPVV
jgi:ABC-2 type transport system permease protein